MVAKMPLLISSRMTSATLTASSSASSLTVMVAGQLDRAALARIERPGPATSRMRRRDAAACAARDGRGCRSYSWPRAPPSMVFVVMAPGATLARNAAGSGVSSARLRAPFLMAMVRQSVVAAHVGTATGEPAGRVDDDRPVRRPDDPQRARASGARVRQATQVRVGTRRGAVAVRRRVAAAPTTPPPRRRALGFGGRFLVGAASAAASARRGLRPSAAGRRPSASAAASCLGAAAAVSAARLGFGRRVVGRRSRRPRLRGGRFAAAGFARLRRCASAVGVGSRRRPAPRPLGVGGRRGRRVGRRRRPSALGRGLAPRRPTRRCGCRSASRSVARRAGRSGPRGRSPARASARAR